MEYIQSGNLEAGLTNAIREAFACKVGKIVEKHKVEMQKEMDKCANEVVAETILKVSSMASFKDNGREIVFTIRKG